MKTLSAKFPSPATEPLTRLAVSALQAEAKLRDIDLTITHESGGDNSVLLVNGSKEITTDRPHLIRETGKLLENFAPRLIAATPVVKAPEPAAAKFIIGVTSCPTGIAHTYMAAEQLEKTARSLGHSIKVETQGAMGIENELTSSDIAAADLIIFAVDIEVEQRERFEGYKVVQVPVQQAIKNPEAIFSAVAR